MAYYDQYLQGSKGLGGPENSYLYSNSAEMSAPQSYLGGAEMSSQMAGGGEAAAGAGGMAAMSNPATAGVMVGGQFLSQYLAQKAADERQKRAQDVQIQQQYGENQNKGFQTLMDTYRGALR